MTDCNHGGQTPLPSRDPAVSENHESPPPDRRHPEINPDGLTTQPGDDLCNSTAELPPFILLDRLSRSGSQSYYLIINVQTEENKIFKEPDIEFLGQRRNYPRTWQGVVVVIVLVVLIMAVTHIALVQSRPENLQTLGLITGQLEIDTRNQVVQQRKWFRFEFWKPSVHTAKDMEDFLSSHPEKIKEYAWQIHDQQKNNISKKNRLFGKRLIGDSAISGYRRYLVYGEGDSDLKRGWWWVVGVQGQYSESFFKWFAETYNEHWGRPDINNAYVEITAIAGE